MNVAVARDVFGTQIPSHVYLDFDMIDDKKPYPLPWYDMPSVGHFEQASSIRVRTQQPRPSEWPRAALADLPPPSFFTCHQNLSAKLRPRHQENDSITPQSLVMITAAFQRKMAPNEETTNVRMQASIVSGLVEKVATAHPLVVTKTEHLATKLVLIWHTFMVTGAKDDSFLDVMTSALENCCPDLKYGPHTRTDGKTAFFNFDNDINEEQAVELIREMSTVNGDLTNVNSGLVMDAHKALRTSARIARGNADNVEEDEKLGHELPFNAILFFLDCCRDTIKPDFDERAILDAVMTALHYSKLYSKNCPRTSLQEAVAIEPTVSQPVTANNFRIILLALKSYLEGAIAHEERVIESVAHQHGGLLKHHSMDALMERLGNAVDTAAATSLFEQLGVLHALQYGAAMTRASRSHGEIIALIDQMLHLVEKEDTR
ncbi:hypothetical protein FLONG3_1330 [Fusarium longipes]|uniref:Uncharacterized protein n=1 Tax=Fusarium longipes TaxID=694270 RepID=A0A395T7T4_9HYPO|nr:hypothetical protein FLONG3_1330 [Fusarium longipes]